MKSNPFKPLGKVQGAAGVQNFFREGWWFHLYLHLVGLTFWGVTFVAKTTTLKPRLNPSRGEGNMPMRLDGVTPLEKFPKCIHLTLRMWLDGIVLNAVGLSGPGIEALLATDKWQQ